MKNRAVIIRKMLPLLLVIVGLASGYFILQADNQKPARFNKNKSKHVRIVQTSELLKGSVVPSWNTSGYVIPYEKINVNALVSGNVQSINPLAIPGGKLNKGQWLVKLDPFSFELSLRSQQAQLEQATANFSLELADQTLAKEELALLKSNDAFDFDESLVLREPQLTVAKAKVSVAENNLEKAKLDLERTVVYMPFDGMVTKKNVGVGTRVSTGTSLFSVINSDTYWLEVKIPHHFLAMLDIDKTAELSQLRLWGKDKVRDAKVISILPELDEKDRQVKVLLAIDEPQLVSSNKPPVFINDFLNVQLRGHTIEDAWTIQHRWLQPDGSIWVVDKNKTLQKRAVEVLFKGRELIYVKSEFEQGDRALTEKPGIAAVGMRVMIRNASKWVGKSNNESSSESSSPINRSDRKNKRDEKRRGNEL